MDVGTVLSAAQTLFAAVQSSELKKTCSILGYKSQLDALQVTVSTISTVLRSAEAKQELSDEEIIYVEDLKDAIYEADDLLDEFVTLVEHKKLTEGDKKMRLFSVFKELGVAYKMSSGVEKIKKKLDAIAYNNQFRFKLDPEPTGKGRPESDSCVNAVDIVGREGDLEKIVGMLLDSNVQHDVSFLTIVGLGGLGKTALAQLVYNDARVTSTFSLRLWTCVSDQDKKEPDVKEILGKILASATGRKHEDSTMDRVQSQLREKLANHKYLLVLDDVWTEKRNQWCGLVKYFIGGQKGSRIVVTTRSQKTAKIIGDSSMYELQGLSEENSWRLFERMAFGLNQVNFPDHDLVEMGREIVNVCAHVPLSLRVVGSLLYGQGKSRWSSFQKMGLASIREGENDIMPILKWSYHYLESPLKSCFCYCALFPKDFEIEKEMLISLWMAQGYIVPLDKSQSIEDAGEEYFSILLRRCFFQDIKKDVFGGIDTFKIHDLMHDMAQSVTGKEIYATNTTGGHLDKKVRHLSVASRRRYGEYFFGKNYIRSYVHVDWDVFLFGEVDLFFLEPLVTNCMCLRALDLSWLKIKRLPCSIGKLLHLRYLDLSYNADLEMLPKSITKLYNLQTFKLTGCEKLKELPKDLSKLVNLRVLDIDDCYRLTYMPRGLGKLSSLHRLSNFIVGGKGRNLSWKQWFYGLEDLKALEKLKGSLEIQIRWPKNAKSIVKEDCRRDGLYLRSKEHLNGIWFNFTHEESDGRVDDEVARRLMEELQPHSNLKRFKMQEYHGARMPGWATLLPNLLQLCLFNCDELECLPFLGNLCNLKVLKLLALEKLEYIEENSPSADSSSTPTPQLLCAKTLSYLPSLRVLSLNNLPELKGWRRSLAGVGNDHLNQNLVVSRSNNEAVWQSLPCLSQLKSLEIIGCPKLTCIPLCPSLEWLYIIKSNERLNEKYIMKGMRS
ncbi:putative disease resistance protein RGA3 [Spinacia oleracea]|uniref:Disease resistance protein RGA3 n=1 Tax=Spinacia oleracea TaxID=3562 RepID=A0ABM3RPE4_SPIOL|nr:putative disease resistance protein RGA3 [Spinacia oleracea]XP_056697469.1 putative disease resistance protein RGA3 [Spinacia oleracea]XP_056697470.1 putative disease resistance protein RGA3 [Spinacia oleracea]XP_056697471.1 putative disease resistance protein RGA3 [Spinacia oleracea]XP_056697472.1 putative disease resistance protein RGA3 [Spinacia oleracea]XP_056697474.1 putative disease resistance protein RGA3 [Spinacia oleracea]XP_056697475.1 putative disease resistance protein RGA3 [Sp